MTEEDRKWMEKVMKFAKVCCAGVFVLFVETATYVHAYRCAHTRSQRTKKDYFKAILIKLT